MVGLYLVLTSYQGAAEPDQAAHDQGYQVSAICSGVQSGQFYQPQEDCYRVNAQPFIQSFLWNVSRSFLVFLVVLSCLESLLLNVLFADLCSMNIEQWTRHRTTLNLTIADLEHRYNFSCYRLIVSSPRMC